MCACVSSSGRAGSARAARGPACRFGRRALQLSGRDCCLWPRGKRRCAPCKEGCASAAGPREPCGDIAFESSRTCGGQAWAASLRDASLHTVPICLFCSAPGVDSLCAESRAGAGAGFDRAGTSCARLDLAGRAGFPGARVLVWGHATRRFCLGAE
ncbi:hypothetical protein BC834DRAFT_181594 [Gloeopeniophorella convolvens]|nr:hypothetical protein BC834DRAFT_181594 [Gloeopeniophorella convolvens]